MMFGLPGLAAFLSAVCHIPDIPHHRDGGRLRSEGTGAWDPFSLENLLDWAGPGWPGR